jgi:ubiquinone/menaquinone biosynthesis C-methylase UbiE
MWKQIISVGLDRSSRPRDCLLMTAEKLRRGTPECLPGIGIRVVWTEAGASRADRRRPRKVSGPRRSCYRAHNVAQAAPGMASGEMGIDANDYVLGHSARELDRLRRQAQVLNPITRHYLIEAGIAPGMRVLDVGSGLGDVAFLAAELVGPSGHVVGVDRSPDALVLARSRAKGESLANVTFVESELAAMAFDQHFDAAIGRYVLCHQPDPVALLRKISRLVRAGGIVLFQESDREQTRSYPPIPTYDMMSEWISETFRRTGVDVRMGIKLYSTFLAAGLPEPTMRLQAMIGGAKALDEVHFEADLAVTLAAAMDETGVATVDELGADSLVDRIVQEMTANQSVIVGRAVIGAWTRLE